MDTPPQENPPQADAARPDLASPTAGTAPRDLVLPVPAGPLRPQLDASQERPSFWRRISMKRFARNGGLEGEANRDTTPKRLTLLEQRLELTQDTIRTQLQQLERRVDEVWEVEEQLSHLVEIQAKLDSLERRQIEQGEAQQTPSRHPLQLLAALTAGTALGLALSQFIPIAG